MIETHIWHFTCTVFRTCVYVSIVFIPIESWILQDPLCCLMMDYLSWLLHFAKTHVDHPFLFN